MKDLFTVYLPLDGYDQDAKPVAKETHFIVCDGLGGDGNSKHSVSDNVYEKDNSAYLGSRKLSEICDEFFSANYDDFFSNDTLKYTVENLKKKIKSDLDQFLILNPRVDSSAGGEVFPTTLASVVFKENEKNIDAVVIWAGDSRAYVFDLEKGLQQLTKDDVVGEFDACFGKDCRMSNCVSQDQQFTLNYSIYKLNKKSVIFVCSDGCFDFLPSPIHFEFEVMRSLFSGENFSASFEKTFRDINPGDDCTVSGCIFNISKDEMRSFIQYRIYECLNAMKTAIDNSDKKYNESVQENKNEIRRITSENRRLNSEVLLSFQNLIIDTFKNGIEKCLSPEQIVVSNILRQYEPYNMLINNIFQEQLKISEMEKQYDEYNKKYKDLEVLVDSAERKRRMAERKDKFSVNSFPYSTRLFGIRIFPSSNLNVENCEQEHYNAYQRYLCNIEEFEKKLSINRNISDYQYMRSDFVNMMNVLLNSLNELERCDNQLKNANSRLSKEILSEKELKTVIMPNVNKDGIICYENYIDECEYLELSKAYDECKHIKDELEKSGYNTLKEKNTSEYVNDFKNGFFKEHFSKLFEIIKSSVDSEKFIPGLNRLNENNKRLNKLQEELNSGETEKRRVWTEYRINYELFKSCDCRGVV